MIKTSVVALDEKKLKGTLVIFAGKKGRLLPGAKVVNRLSSGAVARTIKSSRFIGDAGQMLWVTGQAGDVGPILVTGLGTVKNLSENDWRLRGVDVGKALDRRGVAQATVVLAGPTGKVDEAGAAEAMLEGLHLALYRFDRFKTEQKPHQKAAFRKAVLSVSMEKVAGVRQQTAGVAPLMSGTDLTRDLVNLPPNIVGPAFMAREARKLSSLGVNVQVLTVKQLESLGMNLMLAVGAGAPPDQQPRLIVMKYAGGKKTDPFRAVVGKGVTFDTGGYNLKPSGSIGNMKCDMAGAGAVLGLMKALALRKSPLNVIGVCGCVVNMVSSRAVLPSAVIKSYQGLQVEIGNTDAEGRLVLADAMAYIIKKEKPSEVIDVATLTGSCMIALGGFYAGLFSTNNKVAAGLIAAGEATGEKVWRMPVDDGYAAKSLVADLSNDGKRYGGASTGAVFLKRFTGDTPWAHLDIAGVALNEKIADSSHVPVKGATGYGVRLLLNYLEKHS